MLLSALQDPRTQVTSEPTNNFSRTPKPPRTHLFRGPDAPGRALFRACALSISPHLPERLPDPPHLPTDSPTYARCSCIQLYRGTSSLYHTAACTILYSLQLRAQRAENLRAADTFGRSGHHCFTARTGWDCVCFARTDKTLLVPPLVQRSDRRNHPWRSG